MKIPIAREGQPYVFGTAVASLVFLLSGSRFLRRLGTLGTLLSAGLGWFLRDPDRMIIPIENGVLAPADGKIIRIDEVELPEFFNEPVRRVSIFMSLADCHVNRNPVDGTVIHKSRSEGTFLAAWDDRASEENRRATLGIEGEFKTAVRQVAGLVARQIVCRPEPGDVVRQGERFGIILFGSRVDVYFPRDFRLMVDIGDRTLAGITALAESPPKKSVPRKRAGKRTRAPRKASGRAKDKASEEETTKTEK
ncbi:MAG: phosphatidylserine decarboxylase family protein [Candidatus Hydrogenedentota bacterium]|nr:MAG: phosphatidylserine decarboxylase family protein [Candidatus Hydrogenedentota bacterium]